jgi:uncharacterized protein
MMELNKENILSVLASQKPMLEKEFSIVQLGLFGSYSNGGQTQMSDIDIAFEIAAGQSFTLEKKIRLENYFRNLFDKQVDLVRLKYVNPIIRFSMENDLIYV